MSLLDSFTHVIASNIDESALIKVCALAVRAGGVRSNVVQLAAHLWERDVPLMVLKSNVRHDLRRSN